MMIYNIQKTDQEILQLGELGSGKEELGQEKENEIERLQLK